MSEDLTEITVPEWWKPEGGGMIYRRSCLPPEHPENKYNYIKRTYNVDPEDYGIYHPDMEEVKDMTNEELKLEVMKLRSQLRSIEAWI